MAALLVLALSLQAVAPSGDRLPRLLDGTLEPPTAVATDPFDPLGLEIMASLGIGVGMIALGTFVGAIIPTGGDVGGVLAPHGFILATLMTPLLSATAVWGLEGRSRPGRPWWPVFLTSLPIRLVGALLTLVGVYQWQSYFALMPLGLSLSLIGGTAGEVVAARWGRGTPPKSPGMQVTVFRFPF